MKVLMVNNRLKVYGGEGTYMTSVGDELIRQGHDVQYFGLIDDDGLHGNKYGIYAKKSVNPFKLRENRYNRKQFAKILDCFHPDIIHLNLYYFTLTPSILLEAKKREIPVIQTVHDGKIICPSYQLFVSNQGRACTDCLDGYFNRCVANKCHKNSKLFSLIAYNEATYNRRKGYYNLVNLFVFPSEFMRNLHVKSGIAEERTTVLCNFSRIKKRTELYKSNQRYVLFFGRVIKIKGVDVLAKVVDLLPHVKFKIVGEGDQTYLFHNKTNCELLGFKSGAELEQLIAGAVCSVFPSVCYENCPMSIQESIALGTPAIGSNIGGIPELISEGKTGYIVNGMDEKELAGRIDEVWNDPALSLYMAKNCIHDSQLMDVTDYVAKLECIYEGLLQKTNE